MSKIYLLSNNKYKDVINLEVFKIQYLEPLIDCLKYDALIFTSKNAIYSLNHFNIDWKNIPSYVIAPKTAEVLKQQGGTLEFVGEHSHGNEFAQELIPHLKNKKVLYLKAKKTVSNLSNILLENKISLDEVIVYETICNNQTKINLEKNSIFIFTSPSSIKCFFEQYGWEKSFKAVCIGKTTSKYLPKDVEFVISSKTSIQECIKLAKSI